MIARRTFVAAAFALGIAGCAGPYPTPKPLPLPPPPDPKTVMPALESRIALLIEEEREKIDAKAHTLAIDPELTGIARKRSGDMAAKNYLAHTAPGGETSATLLMAEDANFQGLLGENMASVRYWPAYGVDVDKTARALVDTWLASPKHRENLASPQYSRAGVGAAVSADTVYVTVLFAGDLGLPPHVDQAPPPQ